jgi:hypothetical protein
MDIALLLIAVLLAVGAAAGGYVLATRHADVDLATRDADRAATADAYAQQVIGFLDEQLAGQQPLV